MKTLLVLTSLALIACGDDDRAQRDGGPPADTSRDSGEADASTADDAGAPSDGGALSDAGPGTDAGSSDAGSSDAGSPDASSSAMVDLTFAGCNPDFSGDTVVVNNSDSIAVSSTRGGALIGSIQLALQDERGNIALGTQHRVDTGAVINVIVGTTWTNIAMDSGGVLSGTVPDPIGGSLRVDAYDERAGVIDVTFSSVTVQNPSDGSICQINGRLRTNGLSF